MSRFRYLAPARGELLDATLYYQQRSRRVASSFLEAVQKAIDYVVEYPESSPVLLRQVRGKIISRFPYTLMYRLDEGVVVILAVAHHRQRPGFWVGRS